MIYDLVTAEQFVIACAAFILIASLTSHPRTMGFVTTFWVASLLFFLALDQLWWTLARSAFSNSDWIHSFIPALEGIDAKIWFEQSNYVFIFKTGMLMSLIGLILQSTRK